MVSGRQSTAASWRFSTAGSFCTSRHRDRGRWPSTTCAADWDAGCPHCSHWADSINGIIVHLNHRDVTMIAVSHAPYRKLAAYEKRMGWTFKWLSSFDTDFNYDYHVSFTPEELSAKSA